jgi:hypothetical protein
MTDLLEIQVDTTLVQQFIRQAPDQFAFAAAIALNRTGEDANAALRQAIPQAFTLRDPRLLRYVAPSTLPRDQQANKHTLSVVLKTEAKGRILDPFEFGTPHRQASPDQPVAIPTGDLRFTKQTVIPRRWYPANLGLTPRKEAGSLKPYYALGKGAIAKGLTPFKTGARGGVQVQGKLRTFVLDPKYQRGVSPKQRGVYVRIGPDKGDIRMIWRFVDQVPRPTHLRFRETAERTVAERWEPNFIGAFAFALRTAR